MKTVQRPGKKSTKKPRVYVSVEGSVIQNIDFANCSASLEVIVRDYDTEGTEPERILRDDEGQECLVSVYHPDQ